MVVRTPPSPSPRPPSRAPRPAVFLLPLLLGSLVALLGSGCGAAARQGAGRGDLAGRALASASPTGMVVVPTVEDVMIDGNLMTWADRAFGYLQSGEHAMALPYLEAALSSGQASSLQRAYLYWFKAQAHGALGQDEGEVTALERFVLALDAAPATLVSELSLVNARADKLSAGAARTWARARLFARRIERGGGFGTSLTQAVPIGSLDEANLVLMQLRCGEGLEGRVELVEQETTRAAPGQRARVVDVHRARCVSSAEALEIFFDVTDAAP